METTENRGNIFFLFQSLTKGFALYHLHLAEYSRYYLLAIFTTTRQLGKFFRKQNLRV